MAEFHNVMCGVCDAQHMNNCAEYWCPECDEGLCSTCHKYHSYSKSLRTHVCINVTEYNKLPSSVSLSNHCQDHGFAFTNYCPIDDTLCCPECISSTHNKCKGFLSVPKIIKTAASSTRLKNMEQTLNNLEINIEKSVQNRRNILSNVTQQREKIHVDLKQLRNEINSHLDNLERNLINELEDAETKTKFKMENFISRLNREKYVVLELKNSIGLLKKHATDLQTFLGSRSLKTEVEKVVKNMKNFTEDGNFEPVSLKFCTYDTILQILGTTCLGTISLESDPLILRSEKDIRVQIMTILQQTFMPSINAIKFSLLGTYKIPEPHGSHGYRGCIIHQTGKFIFTSKYASILVVFNMDGAEGEYIPCSSGVNDVTAVDDRTIAIATDNGINIINIESKQTQKVFKTDDQCYGITFYNGALLCCVKSKGIQKMDLSNGNITTLVKQDQLCWDSFVTTYEDRIYQTNWETNTVTCFTSKGEMVWEYKNMSVVKDPLGITVDNISNIYVTSRESNNVVVITGDGKEGRQLLGQQEGLKDAYGIYFDKTKNNLLIVNDVGPAFVYHVS